MKLFGLLFCTTIALGPVDPPSKQAARQNLAFDDAVSLHNQRIRVEVSPRAGRIVWFGRREGQNLLWINGEDPTQLPRNRTRQYIDYGGDKLWPSAQALWGRAMGDSASWPPDGVIDGGRWELVEVSDHHLKMQSPLSPHYGVRAQRTIVIDPDAAAITVVNAINQEVAGIYPVHLWTVTQIKRPEFVLLDIAPNRVGPKLPVVLWQDPTHYAGGVKTRQDDAVAAWYFHHEGVAKIGTLGKWNAAVYDQDIFLQSTHFKPNGAYPDASSVQVRVEPRHVELALLSEFVHLQPGQSLKNIVEWRLIKRIEASPDSVLEAIQAVQ